MPTQTFRVSKGSSTVLTHIARLRFKGNDDKQADGHVLSSDNVRQQKGSVASHVTSLPCILRTLVAIAGKRIERDIRGIIQRAPAMKSLAPIAPRH
jgi:hypothetical protein